MQSRVFAHLGRPHRSAPTTRGRDAIEIGIGIGIGIGIDVSRP